MTSMNLEEQLSAVLNNPEAMSKISSVLGALGGGAAQDSPRQDVQPQQQAQNLPANASPNDFLKNLPDLGGDNRARLLMAIKPFLSEKRAPYVDGAVALLRMMQLGKTGKDLKLF